MSKFSIFPSYVNDVKWQDVFCFVAKKPLFSKLVVPTEENWKFLLNFKATSTYICYNTKKAPLLFNSKKFLNGVRMFLWVISIIYKHIFLISFLTNRSLVYIWYRWRQGTQNVRFLNVLFYYQYSITYLCTAYIFKMSLARL